VTLYEFLDDGGIENKQ